MCFRMGVSLKGMLQVLSRLCLFLFPFIKNFIFLVEVRSQTQIATDVRQVIYVGEMG